MAKAIKPKIETFAKIKVLGVGGAGSSAVNRMIESGIKDLDFIVINTDAQHLDSSLAPIKINIGKETTRGLGAGADPAVGQEAAEESIEEIKEAIEGSDMLFIAFGAGGGTGSGAAHVVAKVAKEMGILTVAFVTRPFSFEGERRDQNAEFAINKISEYVDTLVLIPNDKLLEAIDPATPVSDAFKVVDDLLRQGIQGISDLIVVPGMINLDFADVKTIMKEAGQALMGIGIASGENRAEQAAKNAIESPLLDISVEGARGVLFNVTGGEDMSMHEINSAAAVITEVADQNVNVIFGATIDPNLKDEIIVTVIATGFDVDYLDRSDDQDIDQDTSAGSKGSRIVRRKPKPRRTSRRIQADDEDDFDIDSLVEEIDSTFSDDDTEDEKPSRRKRKSSDLDDYDEDSIWGQDDKDELDKPTFMRRRRSRRKKK